MSATDATAQVRELWNAISPGWERNRDRLFATTRPVSEWLVDHVDPQPGQTILELAAGPGETGFLAAERIGADGRLISTDLAAGMVDAARRGADERGLTMVETRVMDAQEMDLPDASVDGILARFAFMLMPEPARAAREARRVLRPGGRLAYAVWGPAERNPWLTAMVGALIQAGHTIPGDPSGPGGIFSLSTPDRNEALLSGAGFTDVTVAEVEGHMHFADLDDYWGFQTAVSGPVARLAQTLPADEMEAIKAGLEPALEPFTSAGGVDLPDVAVVVAARREE